MNPALVGVDDSFALNGLLCSLRHAANQTVASLERAGPVYEPFTQHAVVLIELEPDVRISCFHVLSILTTRCCVD